MAVYNREETDVLLNFSDNSLVITPSNFYDDTFFISSLYDELDEDILIEFFDDKINVSNSNIDSYIFAILPDFFNDELSILHFLSDNYTLITHSNFYSDILPSFYDYRVLPPLNTQSVLTGFSANSKMFYSFSIQDILSFYSMYLHNLSHHFNTSLNIYDNISYVTISVPIDVFSILSGFKSSLTIIYDLISSLSFNTISKILLKPNALVSILNLNDKVYKIEPLHLQSNFTTNSFYIETMPINIYTLHSILSNFYFEIKFEEIYNLLSYLNIFSKTELTITSEIQSTLLLDTNTKITLFSNQNIQDILNFFAKTNSNLLIKPVDVLNLHENYKFSYFKDIISPINFYSQTAYSLTNFLISYLYYIDNIQPNIKTSLTELLDLISEFKEQKQTQEHLTSILWLWDFLAEVFKNYGVYIYFNFYMPEKFTFLQTNKLNAGNIIFLQDDGIYTIDTEEYEDDNHIILDLSQLQLKNVKKIDKIYYSHQPEELIIIADGEEYYPLVAETFSQVPKGLRAKDYKIVLSGLEELEYLTLFIHPEFRSKK